MIGRLVRLLPTKKKGVKMAELLCDHCGKSREINYRRATWVSGEGSDMISGVLTCRQCGKKTIFGMTNDAITFYPTQNAYGQLSENTPNSVRDIFSDAELCYYGMGFRGAVAMCRACVERALKERNITHGVLEGKIDEAEGTGILTRREYMLAHGSRLVGNDALHRAESVEPSDIPSVLSATSSIVSHLFP